MSWINVIVRPDVFLAQEEVWVGRGVKLME